MNELQHHKEATRHMKRAHPGMIFRTDYGAGLKLTVGQAKTQKALQESDSFPDITVFEPVGKYHGFFAEMKVPEQQLLRTKDLTKMLKNDIKIRKAGDWWDRHIEKQAEMMIRLQAKGYACTFTLGHADFKKKLAEYLAGKEFPVLYVFSEQAPDEDDSPF